MDEHDLRILNAENAIFDLWHVSSLLQTEAALKFNLVVTGGELRIPQADEVRGYIRGALRGGLLPPPPPKKPWWRIVWDGER